MKRITKKESELSLSSKMMEFEGKKAIQSM
jgi:hypothetical protein